MSFRVRVFALFLLVVVAATAATAWLTLAQVTRQVRESAAADRQVVAGITEALRQYALDHGTWDGVGGTVRALARDTGQRIRITDATGAQLADSDVLLGREPRAGGTAAPLFVDPRPEPVFPGGGFVPSQPKMTASAIDRYTRSVTYAGCLTRAGRDVTMSVGALGVPDYADAGTGPAESSGACAPPTAVGDPDELRESGAAIDAACGRQEGAARTDCLRRLFAERTAKVAPQPLTVRLGALDGTGRSLAVGPTVAVAVAVGAAAALGALLLSRTVLRPVRALTAASRGLGEGDLARRVPEAGKDEIAELGRSFNRMAGSLQASEERQRRMVGDIAHELRTPLANLRGYLEALRDEVLTADPELLDSLHEEVLLQQRIVDDLQDLALAEAGVLTYHRAGVDARVLAEACRTAHGALAAAAGVELSAAVPPVPVRLYGDPGRLRQALSNLVGNAVRHTAPGGSVRIEVTERDGLARIAVRDTGSGIPAADLPHLFDRFWRADAARGRATGGSGLGLSIARQIVADHQGGIEVESEVGAGTVFTVALPVRGGATP